MKNTLEKYGLCITILFIVYTSREVVFSAVFILMFTSASSVAFTKLEELSESADLYRGQKSVL